MQRDLLLIFVAYHPSAEEVKNLNKCLDQLSPNVGYSIIVNDYLYGEPVEKLFKNADYYLCLRKNLGYGSAINKLISSLSYVPEIIGVLNTDLTWHNSTFERMCQWLKVNQDACLIVPEIQNPDGEVQKLCKRNPTVLGMLSRRFIPSGLKPTWLRKYDLWYTMEDHDYSSIFEAQYLSGCCMIVRTSAFVDVGGFDERYFLYLEDADITRSISAKGRCLYFPLASVTHSWGRGNYKSIKLMLVNLLSAWTYFTKWGWKLW